MTVSAADKARIDSLLNKPVPGYDPAEMKRPVEPKADKSKPKKA